MKHSIVIREGEAGQNKSAWPIIETPEYDNELSARVGFNTMVSAALNSANPIEITLFKGATKQASFLNAFPL